MNEEYFRSHVMVLKGPLYGLAIRLGLSPDEAADTVQDTFVKLWKSRERIPLDNPDLTRYCLASMRNTVLTALTSRPLHCSLAASALKVDDSPPDFETDDEIYRFNRLINRLPEQQRLVLSLSAFSGLDNRTIADRLQLSEVNVRQLLSRARKKLKELMQNEQQ
ncbi:MAG: sigma-70 family RNA polymerase sigma factor [Bacteroides sp.]|nr:sigma-70 family RNA polymerase sigma factor [Bacteroides sp.]